MNIKGVFQIWMHNGDYHEVPLKECHAWTREGCKMCPDFAAEHADISTGGIGEFNDWTLTIVRTDVGRELMDGMLARRLDRGPPRRRRPRRHRADAQALGEVAQALARVRGRRAPAAADPGGEVATRPAPRRRAQQHQQPTHEQQREPGDGHRARCSTPAPVNASGRVAEMPATSIGTAVGELDRHRRPLGGVVGAVGARTARTNPRRCSRGRRRWSAPRCAA